MVASIIPDYHKFTRQNDSKLHKKSQYGEITTLTDEHVKLNYLTASFKALPGLNAGTLLAGIWISCPVCGLRPLRAAR